MPRGRRRSDAADAAARTGQLEATLADDRVVALRHALNDVVDGRQARDMVHLIGRGGRPAVRNVVVDALVEERRVLRHHANALPQARERYILNRLAVHQDAPTQGVVKAEQQPQERRFARCARYGWVITMRAAAGRPCL